MVKTISKQKDTVFKRVASAYKPTSKLSSGLIKQYTQSGSGSSGAVGRPKGVMKHRSPFNGQPIPAPLFYKQMRAYKRLQAQQADKVQQIKQNQYARQGVAPNQIRQVQMQRLQQMRQVQPQFTRQVPQQLRQPQQLQQGQVVNQGTPVWKWRKGIVDTDVDIMGNRRQIIRQGKESFWN
jgi:hypothetical protein